MRLPKKNFAFIDSQNLNLGIQELGWKLSYEKFRIYLREKYNVDKAYMFIGFVAMNQSLYDKLQEVGFILHFKPTIPDIDGKIKGNVDADLVLRTMIEWNNYDKAVIVSNDGDFYSLVEHLYSSDKLEIVLSTNRKFCSGLLTRSAREKIQFVDDLKEKIQYKKKNTA
ncbi:MAG: NYN domain-containing protein [Patescibacteria group bacterium]|nr:NYN domain-containing protein [Patescibacteria group bacterium]